mmetsp:Transcript_39483/g.98877  ORF Transcript_39483/g.98877 Transcript_39483/m.98877 type:complete len:288 (-) Transcript_39483:1054-1917(-)
MVGDLRRLSVPQVVVKVDLLNLFHPLVVLAIVAKYRLSSRAFPTDIKESIRADDSPIKASICNIAGQIRSIESEELHDKVSCRQTPRRHKCDLHRVPTRQFLIVKSHDDDQLMIRIDSDVLYERTRHCLGPLHAQIRVVHCDVVCGVENGCDLSVGAAARDSLVLTGVKELCSCRIPRSLDGCGVDRLSWVTQCRYVVVLDHQQPLGGRNDCVAADILPVDVHIQHRCLQRQRINFSGLSVNRDNLKHTCLCSTRLLDSICGEQQVFLQQYLYGCRLKFCHSMCQKG